MGDQQDGPRATGDRLHPQEVEEIVRERRREEERGEREERRKEERVAREDRRREDRTAREERREEERKARADRRDEERAAREDRREEERVARTAPEDVHGHSNNRRADEPLHSLTRPSKARRYLQFFAGGRSYWRLRG